MNYNGFLIIKFSQVLYFEYKEEPVSQLDKLQRLEWTTQGARMEKRGNPIRKPGKCIGKAQEAGQERRERSKL